MFYLVQIIFSLLFILVIFCCFFKSFPHQLDWRRGPDMPVAMSGYIQSVEIYDTVYVGGGGTYRLEDAYIVMAYNTQSCQWHTLPPYSTRRFTMTTINNKLVVVGGSNRDGSESSELGEWQPDSNQWTHPFPPMHTPRWLLSVTSYKHWLVVAGGYHGVCLQTVEILDVSNMQWSTGPSTPTPWVRMMSTTITDTWYLMGGACKKWSHYSPDVYSVSLEALVSHSSSDSSNIWNKLPSLNCTQSCPLNIGGSLLAVGGKDKSRKPVSTIQRYVPETNTWVQAGQLPRAVGDCTCIMTSDKVHVMGGEDRNDTLNDLFTSVIP